MTVQVSVNEEVTHTVPENHSGYHSVKLRLCIQFEYRFFRFNIQSSMTGFNHLIREFNLIIQTCEMISNNIYTWISFLYLKLV